MNDFGFWILLAVVIAAFFFMKSRDGVSVEKARGFFKDGAVVIDVRTQGEFASGHLSMAKNIPLDQLADRIGKIVPSKDTVVLCHCASGMRSGSAASKLRRMGYAKSFNLGSLHRAAKILGE